MSQIPQQHFEINMRTFLVWQHCSYTTSIQPSSGCYNEIFDAASQSFLIRATLTLPFWRDSGCTTSVQPPLGRSGGLVMRLSRRMSGAVCAAGTDIQLGVESSSSAGGGH